MRRARVRFGAGAGGTFLLLAVALLLFGCSAWDKVGSGDDVVDTVLTTDLTARRPVPIPSSGNSEGPRATDQVFLDDGTAGPAARTMAPGVSAATGPGSATGGYDLNFENADIGTVAKALLGDTLKLNYVVDRRLQAITISLSSGRPVSRDDILPLLESAVKLAGAAVVKEGPLYKIVPIAEALGSGSVDTVENGKLGPGYGISVLPLRYVSSQTVQRALENFAARQGAVRIDPSRNLLLVQGTSNERASIIDAALALDVDWMKNQSAGIFPLRNATPDTIIAELQNVFGQDKENGGQGPVRFQPMARLNAVFAVAKTPEQISRVQQWVRRLDNADYENTALRVYRVRFSNAKIMANILKEVFTGESAAGAGSLPGNADLAQLTPGASAQQASTLSQDPGRTGQPDDFATRATGTEGTITSTRRTDVASIATTSTSRAALLPNVRITADVANNALLIYANREQYKIIERAITQLDRPPLQVAIDATIVEVTLNKQLEYGIQYYLRSKGGSSIGYGETSTLQRLIPGFNMVLGPASDPRAIIDAFRQITDVKVLSSPSLVVLDNQIATLQVGDQVPIATRSSQSVDTPNAPIVNNIELHNTGVILRVTPRINVNGVVTLDVEQEISNVVNNSIDPTQQTLTPTISQRRIKSSIAVASGQTVLLGGLISSRQQREKSGLPVPFNLNLIGRNQNQVTNTELIVFIRPQIIRDGLDAQLIAEDLRSKLNMVTRQRAPAPAAASAPTTVNPNR